MRSFISVTLIFIALAIINSFSQHRRRGYGKSSKKLAFQVRSDYLKVKPYLKTIKKYSRHFGFDYRLIVAMAKKESNFNPKAIEYIGGRAVSFGLLQINISTGKDIAKELKIKFSRKFLLNPRYNILLGTYYLWKQYTTTCKGLSGLERYKFALAAYNCGPGNVLKALEVTSSWYRGKYYVPQSTVEYVEYIIEWWAIYKKYLEIFS